MKLGNVGETRRQEFVAAGTGEPRTKRGRIREQAAVAVFPPKPPVVPRTVGLPRLFDCDAAREPDRKAKLPELRLVKREQGFHIEVHAIGAFFTADGVLSA